MPRRARIDAPGALHHVICRGIERRTIFWEDSDRDDFLKRLETILSETQTPCYAWALMPNHIHLLLRTGNTPIARVMRQLLSGYAGRVNRLHRRAGHLFQNRYKSMSKATSGSWGIAILSNRFYLRRTNHWKLVTCSNLRDMIFASSCRG